jgi:flagellar basal body-associated protein FliL
MAEEKKEAKPAEKAPAKEADAHGAPKGKGGMGAMLTKLPVLLGGVMVLEAVILFAGFKFLGGGAPKVVVGADLIREGEANAKTAESGHGEAGEKGEGAVAGTPKGSEVEILVVDMKAPNKMSGRTFLYDVSIVASTKAENEDLVKNTFKAREALIKDRIRTIIAQSDPEKLGGGSEPGLETLRRQVKYQLDEIVGDKIIDEVLIPRCIPFRTDY